MSTKVGICKFHIRKLKGIRVKISLTALKKKDGNLTKVKVDEVPCLMGNIASKVASNNTMPGRVVLLVEFFLDKSSYVFLNVVFFQCLGSTVNCILLHLL